MGYIVWDGQKIKILRKREKNLKLNSEILLVTHHNSRLFLLSIIRFASPLLVQSVSNLITLPFSCNKAAMHEFNCYHFFPIVYSPLYMHART